MRSKPCFPDFSLVGAVSGVRLALVVTVTPENFSFRVPPPRILFMEVHFSGRNPA